MRDTLKRLLSAVLVIALVFAIAPPSSWIQASAASGNESTAITVIGTDGKEDTFLADKDYSPEGKNYSYSAESNTLTLDNFSGKKIVATGDLNLYLKGTNTITLAKDEATNSMDGICITNYRNLDISAEEGAILNINGTVKGTNTGFHGIHADRIDIHGGTVNIGIDLEGFCAVFGSGGINGTTSIEGNTNLSIDVKNTGEKVDSNLCGLFGTLTVKEGASGSVNINVEGNEKDGEKDSPTALTGLRVENAGAKIKLTATINGASKKGCCAVGGLYALDFTEGGRAEFNGTVTVAMDPNNGVVRPILLKPNVVSTTPADNNFIQKLNKELRPYPNATDWYAFHDNDGKLLYHSVFEYTADRAPLKWTGGRHFDLHEAKVGETPVIARDRNEDLNTSGNLFFLTGGIHGGSGKYAFTLKNGTFPKNIEIIQLDSSYHWYVWGFYKEPCEAGTVTIEARDYETGETVEFDLKYGEVTEPDKFITVDGTTLEMKTSGNGEGWSYDGTTATLTLDGYNGGKITADKDLNLYLKGTNTITLAKDEATNSMDGICITNYRNLDISAEEGAILNINGTVKGINTKFHGINADRIDIHGGTVNIGINLEGFCAFNDCGGIDGTTSIEGNANISIDVKNTGEKIGSSLCGLYGTLTVKEGASGSVNINVEGNEKDGEKDSPTALTGLRVENAGAKIKLTATINGASKKGCCAVGGLYALDFTEGGRAEFNGTVTVAMDPNNGVVRPILLKPNVVSTTPADNNFIQKLNKELRPYPNATDWYAFHDNDGKLLYHSVFEYTADRAPLKWTGGRHFDLHEAKVGETPVIARDRNEDLNTSGNLFFLTGGIHGGSGKYAFTLKNGTFPKNIEIIQLDSSYHWYVWGFYKEPCEAGTVTIEARDYETGETVEFDLKYGEVTTQKPVTDITLDKSEVTLGIGETVDITAAVNPPDADLPQIILRSDDTSVVYASAGEPSEDGKTVIKLEGISAGKATVYFTTKDNLKTVSMTVYVREAKPSISIDYSRNKLCNFTSGTTYKITGEGIDEEFVATGTDKPIPDDWYGKTLSIVATKGMGTDSDAQVLVIPAIPEAPTGLTTTPASCDADDGVITGTVNGLQYSRDKETWILFFGMEATNLSDGTYFVRLAATDSAFAGKEATVTVEREEKPPVVTGWVQVGADYYYYDSNGKLVTGWTEIDGSHYYLDPEKDGKMITGWQQIGGNWYYFNQWGKMVTGWIQISGKWYYFNQWGKMVTGWVQISGKWYYFNSSGAMLTGWQSIGGKWYYFNSSGAMLTGWQQLGGKWYYFNSSGAMLTGWQQIGGKWYYFNSSGAMLTGWQQISGKWYYFNNSGAMLTGWQSIGGKWYYFNNSGAMLTGTQRINGKTYTFNSSGVWIA